MSEIILYHGSSQEIQFPEIRKTKYTKDFSWGFYCTKNYEQAVRWANRKSENGIVNFYSYTENPELNILKFDAMNDDWLDFIAKCRKGFVHSYDIVECPMADDTIWNYVNDYFEGTITRKMFWEFAEFKYPSHQISFHTLKALNCLKFQKNEVIYE